MGLKRCLFGCLLAMAGTGTAWAMDAGTQDPTPQHATIDSGNRDGGGSDSGAANRDCILPEGNVDGSGAGDSGGTGGIPAAHTRAGRRSSLSWQSLLPGSIQ